MTEQTPPNTRDDIRTAIFSGRHAKTLPVKAFGIDLEMRQPSLGDILDLQELPSAKERVVTSLINYCYVPGTKEKVFDAADKDSILLLPYDDNFTAIQNAIVELTGIDIEDEKGNLEDAPISITS